MKNILVPVDFSDVTDRLVETATRVAKAFDARIWLLHCIDQSPTIASMGEVPMVMPVPEAELSDHFRYQSQKLTELATSLRNEGIDVEVQLKNGLATDEILAGVLRNSIDLIVMGSHGHGALYNLVVGSVTQSVLQNTDTPTLVIPCETRKVKDREKVAAPVAQWEEPMATPY